MNQTNRAMNRVFLLVAGLVMILAGAGAVLVAAWAPARTALESAAMSGSAWVSEVMRSSQIAETGVSWVEVGALALLVIVVLAIVVSLVASIRGRSRTALRATDARTDEGRIVISEAFISDALKHSLLAHHDILSAHVTANEVNKQPVLHVSVTPRQNSDPRRIVDWVDQLVANLAHLTGQQVPAFVSVRSGLRARLAADNRRLS
jgi:uncharacterized membrane protein